MCSEVCCDVAHLSGFEPKAFRLGGGRSILLSYRCTQWGEAKRCAIKSEFILPQTGRRVKAGKARA